MGDESQEVDMKPNLNMMSGLNNEASTSISQEQDQVLAPVPVEVNVKAELSGSLESDSDSEIEENSSIFSRNNCNSTQNDPITLDEEEEEQVLVPEQEQVQKKGQKKLKVTIKKEKSSGEPVAKKSRVEVPKAKKVVIDSSEEEIFSDDEFVPEVNIDGQDQEIQVNENRRTTRGLRYCYTECFKDDPPPVTRKLKPDRNAKKVPELQVIHSLSDFHICKNTTNNNVLIKESCFKELDELEKCLKQYGRGITRLTIDLLVCKSNPIKFLRLLTIYCTKLESLTISEARVKVEEFGSEYWDSEGNSWEEGIILPSLRELIISSTSWLIFNFMKIIIRTCHIRKIQIKVDSEVLHLQFLNRILKCLNHIGIIGSVKTFVIQSDQKENIFLHFKQIKKIGKLKFPSLTTLEIGAGIWEDVTCEIFEGMLSKFSSTLEHFIVQGSYGGVENKQFITISLPPMEKLISFSFQANYEFEEVLESELSKKSQIIQLEDEKLELYRVAVYFPKMDNLSKIILGNLVEIQTTDPSSTPELHFGNFKNLRVFQVGSPWHKIVKYPPTHSKKKCYPVYLKQIQFPDLLKDPSVIVKISQEFIHLKKVTMYLPSVSVLQEFFKSFSKLQVKELYLKTRFDFSCTLEPILRGAPVANAEGEEKEKLDLLRAYGKLDEFLQVNNIELPPNYTQDEIKMEEIRRGVDLDCVSEYGIGSLRHLEILEIRHIPRKIRIPMGDTHWSDIKCKFHPVAIGFTSYPLREREFSKQFKNLRNLQKFDFPNFQISERVQSEIAQSCGFKFLSENQSRTYREKNKVEKEKLKVKIAPSLLSSFDKVKIKPEKE